MNGSFKRQIISLLLVIGLSFLLSGCVKSDVAIQFRDQHHGVLTQHIHLGKPLTSFSDRSVESWLRDVDRRTRQLGGRTRHVSEQDVEVTIPFTSGKDLEQKFNQFFALPTLSPDSPSSSPDSLAITSHLTVQQNNLLLIERDRLSFDVDLRSLGIRSAAGDVLISPNSLINLDFTLQTPWGGKGLAAFGQEDPQLQQGKTLSWQLIPGQTNHLEASFWVPSPLGIGTLGIIILVAIGRTLKSLLTPPPAIEQL